MFVVLHTSCPYKFGTRQQVVALKFQWYHLPPGPKLVGTYGILKKTQLSCD